MADSKPGAATQATETLGQTIFDLVVQVPDSAERIAHDPRQRAQVIARAAARKAAVLSGSLALPPGPLGWLTALPELVAVWKVQAQMVADIAAAFGSSHTLGREHMMYCLFKHMGAHLLRDLAVRTGNRVLVRRSTVQALQMLARSLGVRVTQAVLGRSAARLVPLIGAMGVSAYAYHDTLNVAKTAIALFEQDRLVDDPGSPTPDAVPSPTPQR